MLGASQQTEEGAGVEVELVEEFQLFRDVQVQVPFVETRETIIRERSLLVFFVEDSEAFLFASFVAHQVFVARMAQGLPDVVRVDLLVLLETHDLGTGEALDLSRDTYGKSTVGSCDSGWARGGFLWRRRGRTSCACNRGRVGCRREPGGGNMVPPRDGESDAATVCQTVWHSAGPPSQRIRVSYLFIMLLLPSILYKTDLSYYVIQEYSKKTRQGRERAHQRRLRPGNGRIRVAAAQQGVLLLQDRETDGLL